MITKNIAWSLGATPNKSLETSPQAAALGVNIEPSIPIHVRVTHSQIDDAKTAYAANSPLGAPGVHSVHTVHRVHFHGSLPFCVFRVFRGFTSVAHRPSPIAHFPS
jgi:hypothetical protein